MNRKSLLRPSLLLVLLLSLAALFLFSTPGTSPPRRALSPAEISSSPSLLIKDFSYSRTDETRPVLEIRAAAAEYQEDSRTATLRRARARVYPRSGEEIEIHGPLGRYDLEGEILALPQGVTAVTADGLRIRAGNAVYHHQKQEIEFQSGIQIQGPNLYARGRSLQLETQTGKLVVENGVEARLSSSRAREILGAGPAEE